MSDTRRHVDRDFEEWSERMRLARHRKPIQSLKHQSRDRQSRQLKRDPYRRTLHGRIDTLREQASHDDAEV